MVNRNLVAKKNWKTMRNILIATLTVIIGLIDLKREACAIIYLGFFLLVITITNIKKIIIFIKFECKLNIRWEYACIRTN